MEKKHNMSSKRKATQLTLGAFDYTKKVKHNNEWINFDIPKIVKEEERLKQFSCRHCRKRFLEKKGVIVHEKFCKNK